jgi:hypothetical protein
MAKATHSKNKLKYSELAASTGTREPMTDAPK